jgi:hypothetical protein
MSVAPEIVTGDSISLAVTLKKTTQSLTSTRQQKSRQPWSQPITR